MRIDPSAVDGTVLRLVVRDGAGEDGSTEVDGTIDVGARGRLLGVEVPLPRDSLLAAPWRGDHPPPTAALDAADGTLYLPVAAGMPDVHVRSVTVRLRLIAGPGGGLIAVDVPRRGHGYEIAYPSGNR